MKQVTIIIALVVIGLISFNYFNDTSEDIEGSRNFTQLVSNINVFAGYHTVIPRPKKTHNSRFLAYVFNSSEFRCETFYVSHARVAGSPWSSSPVLASTPATPVSPYPVAYNKEISQSEF